MNAVVVFVEGAADGWYVLRALGQNAGATLDSRKPAELPTPFGKSPGLGGESRHGLILNWHSRAPLEQTLAESTEGHQPVFQVVATLPAASKHESMVLLVRMGGDRQPSKVIELIGRFKDAFGPELRREHTVSQVAFAFVFDADTPQHYGQSAGDGVTHREARFAADYASLLGNCKLTHGSWRLVEQIPWGLFVWHDASTRCGTLEDVVEPALRDDQGFRPRLVAADEYVSSQAQATDEVRCSSAGLAKAEIWVSGDRGMGKERASV